MCDDCGCAGDSARAVVGGQSRFIDARGIPTAPHGQPVTARARPMQSPDAISLIASAMRPFNVVVDSELDDDLGFAAASVVIQNPTLYWWLLPDAPLWVPPMTVNLIHNFPSPPSKARVRFAAPVDVTQPAIVDAGSYATFTFLNAPQLPTTLIVPDAASSVTIVGTVTVAGTVTANPTQPAAGSTTSVPQNAASVTLLAANTARKGASIFNDSSATLYVKFGATASVSSYKIQLPPNALYEIPFPAYTGRIDGIWSAAGAGNARVSEES